MPFFHKMNSPIRNPFSGAFCLGVIGAALTCIGASIREHHVRQEGLSVLVGGCIAGIAASFFSMLLLEQCALKICENISLQNKFVGGGFFLIASILAPQAGTIVLKSNLKWSQMLIDELIGACITGALSLGLLKTFEALQTKAPPISPELVTASIATIPSKKLEPVEELEDFDDLETRSACSAY
jgi:hypothetical protein